MTRKPNRFKRSIKFGITLFMLFSTTVLVFRGSFYFYFAQDLQSVEVLKNYKPATITKVFSEDGEVIGEFYAERGEAVSLERVPIHLVQAFVASQDARFFQHRD